MSAHTRIALALLWLGLLVLAGWWQSQHLQMSGDLRKFMPSARTPAQKLLMEELGDGPGSRLLLMSIRGADASVVAAQSRAMRSELQANPVFTLVSNGSAAGLDAVPERLRPYRYLLSPTLDSGHLDAAYLRDELQQRVADLGSPAAGMLEPLLPSDPTLETLKLAESWQPANGPQQIEGVWFDATGKEALLVAETRAAGFDPNGQQSAVGAIHAAFTKASAGTATKLTLTGPGAFAVEIGGRTSREAGIIGTIDTASLILLLIVAYRSWKIPLFGVLPLASAGIAGLAAVAAFFDGVHGITIAFGFTLIGVVQDYPIHLFSHQRRGITPWENARHIWPTLATGVASTCIAYLTFLASGVDGLKQLAVFTIIGLLTAALATRLLLPALIDPDPRDPADSRVLGRLWDRIERLPRPPGWLLGVLTAVGLAVVGFAPSTVWQNDLSKLTPVPAASMQADMHLRSALGAPDVRYLLLLQGPDAESVLEQSEALRPTLDRMVASGALGGYDMAARYLPSARTQRERQQSLPDAATLQASLRSALAGSPFRSDAFTDFVRDVGIARTAPPLTAKALAGTPLEATLGGLLLQRAHASTALVTLSGIRDTKAIEAAAEWHGGFLLDLKDASESLVVAYRNRVLLSLAVAAVLLVLTVGIALRSTHRMRQVLVPMALSLLLVVAVLRGCGVELTLFHLVAFILAAGLGLDYALFFEHAGDDRADQLRTLHALIVCSLTTLVVFFLLALSSIPVLRAIGVTVTLGVVFNFVLALLVAREPSRRDAA